MSKKEEFSRGEEGPIARRKAQNRQAEIFQAMEERDYFKTPRKDESF